MLIYRGSFSILHECGGDPFVYRGYPVPQKYSPREWRLSYMEKDMFTKQEFKPQGYKENVERLNLFYHSEFYQDLKKLYSNYLNKVEDALYQDPDSSDEFLYIALGEKYKLDVSKKNNSFCLIDKVGNSEIALGADAICGVKCLAKYYPDLDDWIDAYETIRSQTSLHFVWPRHKLPTINTLRYIKYLDRIDFTLFDLKNYFEGNKNTPLARAYKNEVTNLWLSQFYDFPSFVKKMQLGRFVDKKYNVLNIASRQNEIIKKFPTKSELSNSMPIYADSLISLVKDNII